MKLVQFLSLAAILAGGCAVDTADTTINDFEDDSALESGKGDSIESTSTYYLGQMDLRPCVDTSCGGYFVRRANAQRTECADGEMHESCKADILDFSALDLSEEQLGKLNADFGRGALLVRGSIEHGVAGVDYPTDSPPRDVVRVTEAYLAQIESDMPSNDVIYRVNDNNIRCIVAPCFSAHQAKLNSTRNREISDVNVEDSGASEEVQSHALGLLHQDSGVILAGVNRNETSSGPARLRGVRMDVSQIYLPVEREAPPEVLMCTEDSECRTTSYPTLVRSIDDCYCPTCPTPALAVEAERNAEAYERICSMRPMDCRPRPCAPPPPVGCEAGHCGYVFR